MPHAIWQAASQLHMGPRRADDIVSELKLEDRQQTWRFYLMQTAYRPQD